MMPFVRQAHFMNERMTMQRACSPTTLFFVAAFAAILAMVTASFLYELIPHSFPSQPGTHTPPHAPDRFVVDPPVRQHNHPRESKRH